MMDNRKLIIYMLLGLGLILLYNSVLVPWLDPKFVPVIVTDVPTGPDVWLKLVILGVGGGGPLTAALNAANTTPHLSVAPNVAFAVAFPKAVWI